MTKVPSDDERRRINEVIRRQLALLAAADAGQLDGHECIECGAAQVEIWFTKPPGGGCNTFAICAACGWSIKAVGDAEPPCFTPARLRLDIDQQPRRFPYLG